MINLGATDYCFVNLDVFTECEKFKSILVKRIIEREINFLIAR